MTGTTDTVKLYGFTREEIEKARRALASIWHVSISTVTDAEAVRVLMVGKHDGDSRHE